MRALHEARRRQSRPDREDDLTVAAPPSLAAGAGSLWTVGADGILRRIDPRFGAIVANVHTFRPSSLLVGGPAAGAVAFGNGAVWVASGGYGATPRASRKSIHIRTASSTSS
jgi:hypothetical protein